MRILGLDVGDKNIGVAISDGLGWTAQGLPNIKVQGQGQVSIALGEIIKENQITEVVVGMPLNMNGTSGPAAQKVANFIEELKKQISIPIKIWDERLSSLQAEKIMIAADLSRKKRKKRIDRLAAQLILQSYLDAKNV